MTNHPDNRNRPRGGPLPGRFPSQPADDFPLLREDPGAAPYSDVDDLPFPDFARWIDDELVKLEARWSHLSVPIDATARLKLREFRLNSQKP